MYRGQLHWSVLLWRAIVAAVFVAFGVSILIAIVRYGEALGIWAVVAMALIVVGDIPLIAALIKKSSAEFAVTNKRVILKEGIVRRKTAEIFLSKVESVGVDQTILGRIFRYGSIVIRGTGGSSEPFHSIAHPLEFRRQVQEQIGKLDSPTAGATTEGTVSK